MRRHELADLQGQAGKADQTMRIAQILIGLGFIVFLGYPAVVAVLSFLTAAPTARQRPHHLSPYR